MPNVPNLPGVPPLSSYAGNVFSLILGDLVSALSFSQPPWGIFLNGEPAIEVNSITGFDYKQDWSISDYPVEDGGFQSYNKVELPYDARVRITSGSSIADRSIMLAELETLAKSLDLYDIVTPEKVYTSVNISHYDFHRTATSGLGMIVADVWFTEIRVSSTTTFMNTQQPGNAGPQSSGNVQPQTPTASQGAYMTDTLNGLRQVGIQ